MSIVLRRKKMNKLYTLSIIPLGRYTMTSILYPFAMAKKHEHWLCSTKWRDFGLFALRVSIAFVFITAGYNKLGNIEMFTGMLDGMNFPAVTFFAYLVALIELIGGVMILFGVYTKYAAIALSVIMLVAILTAHMGGPVNGYYTPLAALGGCVALIGLGSGNWNLLKQKCPYVPQK